MSAFLQSLMEQRRKFLDGLDANKGDINLDIFEDFYPDQAHFVFELLQNAEDAGATEAAFTLVGDGCWFEHNGTRAFSESDVRSITGIHNSTKTKAPDQIGKFGVGFKSVFVYTLTPTIYSTDFSFRISRLVMPEPVSPDPVIGQKTKFWLPFNNTNKDPQTAFSEIKAGLNELEETALLFLLNIESIKWQVKDEMSGEILRVAHDDFHIEVMKQINGQTTTSSHFLKFDESVAALEKQRVAIAFVLDFLPNVHAFSSQKPLSRQLKIAPTPGKVAVFFPANKESSGLRFHLHAPFVPELSRASIKSTPANNPLFDQLAALAASALPKIRDLDLLTTEFLGVLPNPHDQLGEGYGYELIRASICDAMKSEPLFPTFTKGHAPANTLIQAKASLKELLADDDLMFLMRRSDNPPGRAANRALQGTNIDRFMTGLDIQTWDIEEFVDCIDKNASENRWQGVNTHFMDWLSEKSVDWHQQLYSLLERESEAREQIHRLKRCRIVRLMDGTYSTGPACHFAEERHLKTVGVRCVDPTVFSAGRSKAQQESARKFLESTGVTTVGERQLVEALLKHKYSSNQRPLNEKEYPQHLRRFMRLLAEDPSSRALLSSHAIFIGNDNKWHKAVEIYLDQPYLDTGLAECAGTIGTSIQQSALASFYQSLPIEIEKISDFAVKLGARTILEIRNAHCQKNPQWDHLRSAPGERYGNSINKDFRIDGFESLVGKKSMKLANLVWNTMCSLPRTENGIDPRYGGNPLRAIYQVNDRGGPRFADSQLVHMLRQHPWVPQGNGAFERPIHARAELLPEGFAFDPGWPWIKAIQFGRSVRLQDQKAEAEAAATIDRQRRQQEAARSLGFEDTDTARKLAAIPLDEQNRLVADWERRKSVVLPDHESGNPERRKERIIAHATNAPGRRTEDRTRSVSIGREEVKAEAKQYLRQQYTNADAEQICQICKDVLPFKLDDGLYYFEAVELLPELKQHHDQNYLCLCPNHAAKFKHANGSIATLKQQLRGQTENELNVVLAQRNEGVYFTKTHLADLRTIIETDSDAMIVEKEALRNFTGT